jgi:hypothetical protein
MQMTSNRTFMYGTFASPEEFSGLRPGLPPEVAIEILREFSASELVGKIYVKGRGGNWVPVSDPAVRDYIWYRDFKKTKNLEFWMDGSAPWKVLYFRIESDDAGPYLAVGLKLSR